MCRALAPEFTNPSKFDSDDIKARVKGIVDGISGRFGKRDVLMGGLQSKIVAWTLWFVALPPRFFSRLLNS
jgi:hypothetical protein